MRTPGVRHIRRLTPETRVAWENVVITSKWLLSLSQKRAYNFEFPASHSSFQERNTSLLSALRLAPLKDSENTHLFAGAIASPLFYRERVRSSSPCEISGEHTRACRQGSELRG